MKFLMALLGLALAATTFVSPARADESTGTVNLTENLTNFRPHVGRLCYGEFFGTYSNGVRAHFFLDGHRITIKVGDFMFMGHMRCDQWGRQADIRYRVRNSVIPGEVIGEGRIFAEHGYNASIGVNQNNGLSFNGHRR